MISLTLCSYSQDNKKKKNPLNVLNSFILKSKVTKKAFKKIGMDTASQDFKRTIDYVNGHMGTGDSKKSFERMKKHIKQKYDKSKRYSSGQYNKSDSRLLEKTIIKKLKRQSRKNQFSISDFSRYYYPSRDVADGNGWYYIHHAVKHRNYSIVRLILDRGFHVNKKNRRGETALELALKDRKAARIIELLLSYGADAYDSDLISVAVRYSNKEGINLILPYSSRRGLNKGLLTAYQIGNTSQIRFLLKKGAYHKRSYQERYIVACLKNYNDKKIKILLFNNTMKEIFDVNNVVVLALKHHNYDLLNKLSESTINLNVSQINKIINNADIKTLKYIKPILSESLKTFSKKEDRYFVKNLCDKENYELLYFVKNNFDKNYLKGIDDEIAMKLQFYPLVRWLPVGLESVNSLLKESAKKEGVGLILIFLLMILPVLLYIILVRKKIWIKILVVIFYFALVRFLSLVTLELVISDIYNFRPEDAILTPLVIGTIWLIFTLSLNRIRRSRRSRRLRKLAVPVINE